MGWIGLTVSNRATDSHRCQNENPTEGRCSRRWSRGYSSLCLFVQRSEVTVRRRVAPPPAVPEPYVILFESYGSSVQVALVMGTMAGSVYALLEPEDDPLK